MSTTNALLTSYAITDAWENNALRSNLKEYKKALDSINNDYSEELLLSKFLAQELKILKPDALIFSPVVREEIRAHARAELARSNSFKAVQNLSLDLPSILQNKIEEYNEYKHNEKYRIEVEKVEEKRRFFDLGKVVGYRFFQHKFDFEHDAIDFKNRALHELQNSTVHKPFVLDLK